MNNVDALVLDGFAAGQVHTVDPRIGTIKIPEPLPMPIFPEDFSDCESEYKAQIYYLEQLKTNDPSMQPVVWWFFVTGDVHHLQKHKTTYIIRRLVEMATKRTKGG